MVYNRIFDIEYHYNLLHNEGTFSFYLLLFFIIS